MAVLLRIEYNMDNNSRAKELNSVIRICWMLVAFCVAVAGILAFLWSKNNVSGAMVILSMQFQLVHFIGVMYIRNGCKKEIRYIEYLEREVEMRLRSQFKHEKIELVEVDTED